MKNKILCFFGFHDWSQYRGYYKEHVADGAHCLRPNCEAVYHD